MNSVDLGILDTQTPLFVFGGAYGNFEATRAVLERARTLNIPTSHIFSTGDTVAYCADAQKTASLIRDTNIQAIQGNCEESIAQNAADCGCGFDAGTSCDLLSKAWFEHCQKDIKNDIRAWFKTLPHRITFQYHGRLFHVLHGSDQNMNDFIFASTADAIFEKAFKTTQSDVILAGHCGLPFTKIMGETCWHNSGAVGMPANDGTSRIWYSVIHPLANDTLKFEHKFLEYDYMQTAQKMRKARLPKAYANTLETGHWASLDILPDTERSQAGIQLNEQSIIF